MKDGSAVHITASGLFVEGEGGEGEVNVTPEEVEGTAWRCLLAHF